MFTESQLIVPTINILRDNGGSIDTGDLIKTLKQTLPLDEEDLAILPSGFSIRFDQIVRNLKCNNHLASMGLVDHYAGGFKLTDKGRSIGMQELEDKVDIQFSRKSNILTLQAALSQYVRKVMNGSFKKNMVAATAIRAKFDTLPKFTNDDDRLAAVGVLVEEYAAANPKNMVTA